MTQVKAEEYRELQSNSSELLEQAKHDRIAGNEEGAAYARWLAGQMRLTMARLALVEGDYETAAQAGLSAADCFLQARAWKQVPRTLAFVRPIFGQGHIPRSNVELWEDHADRIREFQALERDILEFPQRFGGPTGLLQQSAETFRMLRQSIRQFPGYDQLHYLLFLQALPLGEREVAVDHLMWAYRFDPDDENYVGLLCKYWTEAGHFDDAIDVGREFLDRHPQAGLPRLRVAHALLDRPANGVDAPEAEVLEILLPLTNDEERTDLVRFQALALAAACYHAQGEWRETLKQLIALEELAETLALPATIQAGATLADWLPPADERAVPRRPFFLLDEQREQLLQWGRHGA